MANLNTSPIAFAIGEDHCRSECEDCQGKNPMLIITRKKHERIVIRGDIVIVVARILDDRVRLGFKTPPSAYIHTPVPENYHGMLVLSRKVGEKVGNQVFGAIDEQMSVTVLEIMNDTVRLGVEAPQEWMVELRGKREDASEE